MKSNTVKARVVAGDWHDKTVKEIAAELGCSVASVRSAMYEIEADAGAPVPHRTGWAGAKLVVNGKPRTLTEALLESDWSDLTTPEIAEVLGVTPKQVTSALYKYHSTTGKEIPHIKSKRGPKPKERKPKPEEPDQHEEPLEDFELLRDLSKAGVSAEEAAEAGKLLAEAALASTKVPLEPEEGYTAIPDMKTPEWTPEEAEQIKAYCEENGIDPHRVVGYKDPVPDYASKEFLEQAKRDIDCGISAGFQAGIDTDSGCHGNPEPAGAFC